MIGVPGRDAVNLVVVLSARVYARESVTIHHRSAAAVPAAATTTTTSRVTESNVPVRNDFTLALGKTFEHIVDY